MEASSSSRMFRVSGYCCAGVAIRSSCSEMGTGLGVPGPPETLRLVPPWFGDDARLQGLTTPLALRSIRSHGSGCIPFRPYEAREYG